MKLFTRRLRGVLGNATVWGLSWFAGASLWLLGSHLLGWIPTTGSWATAFWPNVLWIAANIGVTGFLTGGAFSAFLQIAYADRPLMNIKVIRFAIGGAMVAALCSPVVTLIARTGLGLGMGLPGDLVSGGLFAAVLGAVTAGGSIRIAQQASASLMAAETAELESEQRQALSLLEGGTA